jgi:hypothetical protein
LPPLRLTARLYTGAALTLTGLRASPPVEFLEGILAVKGYMFSSNYT